MRPFLYKHNLNKPPDSRPKVSKLIPTLLYIFAKGSYRISNCECLTRCWKTATNDPALPLIFFAETSSCNGTRLLRITKSTS